MMDISVTDKKCWYRGFCFIYSSSQNSDVQSFTSQLDLLYTNIIIIIVICLQNDEAEAENYAVMDFSTRRVKKGNKKKTESPQECVYSDVRAYNHN